MSFFGYADAWAYAKANNFGDFSKKDQPASSNMIKVTTKDGTKWVPRDSSVGKAESKIKGQVSDFDARQVASLANAKNPAYHYPGVATGYDRRAGGWARSDRGVGGLVGLSAGRRNADNFIKELDTAISSIDGVMNLVAGGRDTSLDNLWFEHNLRKADNPVSGLSALSNSEAMYGSPAAYMYANPAMATYGDIDRTNAAYMSPANDTYPVGAIDASLDTDLYAPRGDVNPFGVSPDGANCTWYAYGRALEHGADPNKIENIFVPGDANANRWIDHALNAGVPVDQTPKVGSIAAWKSHPYWGSLGHVGVVEKVYEDGSFDIAHSGWTIVERRGTKAALDTLTPGSAQYEGVHFIHVK